MIPPASFKDLQQFADSGLFRGHPHGQHYWPRLADGEEWASPFGPFWHADQGLLACGYERPLRALDGEHF